MHVLCHVDVPLCVSVDIVALKLPYVLQSSWNVMAHGDAREGKRRGNWRMECLASTFHTTSEHVVSSITTADAHSSAASSRLNWRPCWLKWTRPFRRKTKSGFCACAITFQTQSTRSDRLAGRSARLFRLTSRYKKKLITVPDMKISNWITTATISSWIHIRSVLVCTLNVTIYYIT